MGVCCECVLACWVWGLLLCVLWAFAVRWVGWCLWVGFWVLVFGLVFWMLGLVFGGFGIGVLGWCLGCFGRDGLGCWVCVLYVLSQGCGWLWLGFWDRVLGLLVVFGWSCSMVVCGCAH